MRLISLQAERAPPARVFSFCFCLTSYGAKGFGTCAESNAKAVATG